MPHTRRRSGLGLACLLCATGVAVADGTLPPSAPSADLTAQILDEERDAEERSFALARARVSFPQRLSVGIGAILAQQPTSFDCQTVCNLRGIVLQAEPGLDGGRLAVGWADLMGESGKHERFLSRVYMGWGVKGALLRTWGDADLVPHDQTLAGVEGDFTVIQLNFSLGAFRALSPEDARDSWVLTGGFGWGF